MLSAQAVILFLQMYFPIGTRSIDLIVTKKTIFPSLLTIHHQSNAEIGLLQEYILQSKCLWSQEFPMVETSNHCLSFVLVKLNVEQGAAVAGRTQNDFSEAKASKICVETCQGPNNIVLFIWKKFHIS